MAGYVRIWLFRDSITILLTITSFDYDLKLSKDGHEVWKSGFG